MKAIGSDANNDRLESSIYKYILQHTLKDQLFLVFVTLISMPLVYFALDIPKIIVNDALVDSASVFHLFGFELSQIQYLVVLSMVFLGLVIVNGLVKYYINVYRGVLGERMLRRLRYTLYSRILRFPLSHFQKVSSSEIIPMVTAETEPLGGFIGESIGLPVFQGGLLITYIYFIFVQDVWLGVAAISLYPIQMIVIPRLQRRINELGRQRVQTVRKLADRIGESVNASADIRINDAGHRERADVSNRLGRIFSIRNEIYRRKFFVKFFNNLLGQLTPFFFYSVGGYLVIKGDLSLGALVAVLAAYKDIGPPWKELLKFYQTSEDVRIKYTQIIQQFEPDQMTDAELHVMQPEVVPCFEKSIVGSQLSVSTEHNTAILKTLNFDIIIPRHSCIYTDNQDAARELTMLLASLEPAGSGSLKIDGQVVGSFAEAVLGQNIGFCNQRTYIFNTSVKNNLFYGLMQRLDKSESGLSGVELKEAKASGNSLEKFGGNWIDITRANTKTEKEFEQRVKNVLKIVELDDEIISLALHSDITASKNHGLIQSLIQSRSEVKSAMEVIDIDGIIETFNVDSYGDNMTVAENLLFGIPIDPQMTEEKLVELPEVGHILRESNLETKFVNIGVKLAELMLELFLGVDEHSEMFAQYSFIEATNLETFRGLVAKANVQGTNEFNDEEKAKFISLTMQLSPAIHRLDMINQETKQSIVNARIKLMERLGRQNNFIQFIDQDQYQSGMTVQENLLFGKIVYSKRHLQNRIDEKLREQLEKLNLSDPLRLIGLEFECGNSGSKLSQSVRCRLALARTLLKSPDILIVDGVLAGLDENSQDRILQSVRTDRDGRNLIWTDSRLQAAQKFDEILELTNGQLKKVEL